MAGNGSDSAPFSARPFTLDLAVSESAVNNTANTSTASFTLKMNPTSTYTSFNLNANPWTVYINGVSGSGTFSYDFRTSSTTTRTIGSGTRSLPHDTAGNLGGVAIRATANGGTPVGTADTGNSTTTAFTSIDRTPNTPATPGVTQNGNGSFTITLVNPGTANSGPATSVYFEIYDATTGVWDFTSRSAGTISLTPTHQYIFRAKAVNVNATEYSSNTGLYAGVPNVPSYSSITRVGRTIQIGDPVSNGINGSDITGYTVWRQTYDINGGFGYNDWTPVSYPSNSDDLAPGSSYSFVLSANSAVGSSDWNWSEVYTIPNLPTSGYVNNISKSGKKLNISWTASYPDSYNGSYINAYEVYISDDTSGYTNWTYVGSVPGFITSIQTGDQTPGRIYRARVYTITDVNNSSAYPVYATSSAFLLSSFGYRHDGTGFNTPITNMERFNGTTWVPVTSVQISNGSTFNDLTS